MIGVGAGQQSRVDCVKLAGRKVAIWHLRQHPKVQGLAFKSGVKRQERVNARVRYIEGDMAPLSSRRSTRCSRPFRSRSRLPRRRSSSIT